MLPYRIEPSVLKTKTAAIICQNHTRHQACRALALSARSVANSASSPSGHAATRENEHRLVYYSFAARSKDTNNECIIPQRFQLLYHIAFFVREVFYCSRSVVVVVLLGQLCALPRLPLHSLGRLALVLVVRLAHLTIHTHTVHT